MLRVDDDKGAEILDDLGDRGGNTLLALVQKMTYPLGS